MGRIGFIALTIGTIFVGYKLNGLFKVPGVPKLNDTWWGPSTTDTTIKSFKIDVSEEILGDLKQRLDNARRFTPSLEGVQQQYGMNTDLLEEIIEFWKSKYNWREREKFLNKFPQFTTNIQGLDLHFIHVKPRGIPQGMITLPLMLLHGWPGSIREFYELIPLLTEINDSNKKHGFIFEVIVPSLPGYGFSKPSVKPGLGPAQIGVVLKNLMFRLGFKQFYLQGGDWGAIIVSHMASLFPEQVLGVHSNLCAVLTPKNFLLHLLGSIYPPFIVGKKHESKMYPISRWFEDSILETGYLHLQATKPDTLGVALNDSPVGLAAYILEKFTTGTNFEYKKRLDGGLKIKFAYEDLLDNIMIYWVTNSMTTAMRLYSEGFNKSQYGLRIDSIPVEVPYACAKFPNEIIYMPDFMLRSKYKNLVHSSEIEEGGHFAAFEFPKLLAKDIWEGVEEMEKWYNEEL